MFIIKTLYFPSKKKQFPFYEVLKRQQTVTSSFEVTWSKSFNKLGFGSFHAHAQTSRIVIGHIEKPSWNDLHKENIFSSQENTASTIF